MIKNRLAVAALLGFGAILTAHAQAPAAANSTRGESAGDAMTAGGEELAPATFVKKAAQGGMTEVALSRAAATQSQDPKVRKFANQMVTDHGAANKELASVAKRKGLNVPASLDAEHRAVVQRINSKSGSEFDSAYSKQMMSDHEKTVALFEGATKSSDPDLAGFAKQTLPTLKEHKHMADQLPGAMHAANSGESVPQRK